MFTTVNCNLVSSVSAWNYQVASGGLGGREGLHMVNGTENKSSAQLNSFLPVPP